MSQKVENLALLHGDFAALDPEKLAGLEQHWNIFVEEERPDA